MKVVLDTNVFISGIFYNGVPYKILEAWRDGKIKFILSTEILGEYSRVARVLNEKYPEVKIQPIIDLLTVKSELITSHSFPEQICKDPNDDKFLACALLSKAKIIITGDKYLLELNGYENLEIINPREFYDKYLM